MKWFASHSNAIKQHMSCCSWEVSFVISSFLKLKKERCVVASQHFFAFKDCRDQLFNFTSALLFLLDGGFQLPSIAWCHLSAGFSSWQLWTAAGPASHLDSHYDDALLEYVQSQ